MCGEQNSRCVLYNHSRGKEGKVEEDYRQNFSLFPFVCLRLSFHVCLVKLEVCLFLSFYTSSDTLTFLFSLSVPLHTSLRLFWIWGGLIVGRKKMSQRKCRSSVFSSSLHTITEEKMEVITNKFCMCFPITTLLFLPIHWTFKNISKNKTKQATPLSHVLLNR